jgi:hypothetical protein
MGVVGVEARGHGPICCVDGAEGAIFTLQVVRRFQDFLRKPTTLSETKFAGLY